MKFKPVWISSIGHLNKFAEILSSSNVLQKITGYYKIPDDFPHIQLPLISKVPIVFFGTAEVNMEGNNISFTPLDFKTIGGQYRNITQIQFQLIKADVQSIEKYHPQPIFAKYFIINWIRIKTRLDIFDGDFLICVGGSGPRMSKIQNLTNNLYNELIEFVWN